MGPLCYGIPLLWDSSVMGFLCYGWDHSMSWNHYVIYDQVYSKLLRKKNQSFFTQVLAYVLPLQDGGTPLMAALLGGHIECVKLLLDRGARVNQQDKVIAVLGADQNALKREWYK